MGRIKRGYNLKSVADTNQSSVYGANISSNVFITSGETITRNINL